MPNYLDTLLQLATQGQLPPVPNPAQPVPLPGVFQPTPTPTDLAVGAPPPMPPAAPLPAADNNFVGNFAGERPAPPTFQAPSTLQRIANALLGFGAGVQGQGPQFLAQLQEQRDRPIREYQRQLADFEQRRTRGIEIDTRRRERQQEATTRAAEAGADREFQQWLRRANIVDAEAAQRAREAFEINKLREQERIAEEKAAQQARAQQERDARQFASKYRTLGATDTIANELGRYDAGLTDKLSAAAGKWQSTKAQLDDARAERLARIAAGGGGRTSADRNEVEIVDSQGNVLDRLPYSQIKFDTYGQIQGYPDARLRSPRGQQTAAPAGPVIPSLFPANLGFPELTPAPTPQAAAPKASGKTITMAEIRSLAKQEGVSPGAAVKQFKDAGYTIQK